MKDYFDIWLLARDFSFEGMTLKAAIEATFFRARVPLPDNIPMGLTAAFAENPAKRSQWEAFVRQRVAMPETTPALTQVVVKMRDFLLPPLQALQTEQRFVMRWQPDGSWQADSQIN